MDVYRQSQAARLAGDIPEQIILKSRVLSLEGDIAFHKVSINLLDGLHGFGGAEIERAKVGSLKLDGYRAILLLLLQNRRYHFCDVFLQCEGKHVAADVFQIPAQQHSFALKEEFAVRGFTGERGVFQRKNQRVVEWHPAETWRLQSASHG